MSRRDLDPDLRAAIHAAAREAAKRFKPSDMDQAVLLIRADRQRRAARVRASSDPRARRQEPAA